MKKLVMSIGGLYVAGWFRGSELSSDHRVAGSSLAGCKSSFIADLQVI
jgi:hypothetical protein